ncbi:hypothetical protein QFC22_006401 [Naganishia vaughanmartiniae]|uniref:Uncharacterized protein n=1 Tax=Naganishia vaughanmartiniae TaxID=1424756 RepID=A0ACC2WKZ7_9TREE|nr:hypothetical protein QFC22_006401 [Naganishia vaughanmartiniae]
MFVQHYGDARQGHHSYPALETANQTENQSHQQQQHGIIQTPLTSHQQLSQGHLQQDGQRFPASPVPVHSPAGSAVAYAQQHATLPSNTFNNIASHGQNSLRPIVTDHHVASPSRTPHDHQGLAANATSFHSTTGSQPSSAAHPDGPTESYIDPLIYTPDLDTTSSSSRRSRGRPRKWASEADRRAAEAQRRRDTALAKKFGLPLPPKAAGTFQASPSEESDAARTNSRSTSTRNPYVFFDKDYGHHTPGSEGAVSARDLIVNWLARDGNYKAWSKWTVPERDLVCKEFQVEMERHGMAEREILSIRQQITFIQRGAREARKFEIAHQHDELSPNELRKVTPLLDEHTTPQQAMVKLRWPYYEKLKDHVLAESLLQVTDIPPQPNEQSHDDAGNMDMTIDMDNIDHNLSGPSTSLTATLADTTLAQALRSVGTWRGASDPTEQEIAAVTSRANQLIHAAVPGSIQNQPGNPTTTQQQTTTTPRTPAPAPAVQPATSRKRDAEAWDLEKQQIRQKLELEKEDRRAKERIAERELHLQSIKAFMELLRDGLTRNQAGRVVWQDAWPAMKKSMDEEDE